VGAWRALALEVECGRFSFIPVAKLYHVSLLRPFPAGCEDGRGRAISGLRRCTSQIRRRGLYTDVQAYVYMTGSVSMRRRPPAQPSSSRASGLTTIS
jgi:hypothetical protein